MIGLIVLRNLKTIFFRLRSDQYVSQKQGSFPTRKSPTNTSLPRRTDRTKVVSASFLIRFTIALKSLCHGIATLLQGCGKFTAAILQIPLQLECEYITTVAVHSHRDSFSIVQYSQTVFTDPQQLAGVCIKFALRSLKVATTLVRDCQKVVDYR